MLLLFNPYLSHKPVFRGRRLAKSLLKDQTTSLILWNAYAQMEKSHDRMDEVGHRHCI